jgi:DNA-binding IclR family transcriptional regulator
VSGHGDGPADAVDDTDLVPRLLALLLSEDGASLPRVAKRLGMQASTLQRLLTALGSDAAFGGLGLVEQRQQRGRVCLFLTARGRALGEGS